MERFSKASVVLQAVIFLFLVTLGCTSCNFGNLFSPSYDESAREFFEYWSSTCQFADIQYVSPYTEIDGKPNLSALGEIEIDLIVINPKEYALLCKSDESYKCFSLKNASGNLSYSGYTENTVDHSKIKIKANLTDASEGDTITLTGCLWPKNRTSFSESELAAQSPELFYTAEFIQNTPPDNISNMYVPEDLFSGTNKHYLSFDVPDQSLNRNIGSTYDVNYYLRESDGQLYHKGGKILSLSDNRQSGSNTFLYYFDEQEDNLSYEYTVQVLGPRGLKSELYSTDPGLGVHQLVDPTITIENELNGLTDEEGFDCIEVESDTDFVTYTAAAAFEEDTLTVTVDGNLVINGDYAVSGIGQHTIVATSSKDNSRPVSVSRKIRIVKTPEPATFTFGTEFNGFTDEATGRDYMEVETAQSTVSYTISPTEEDTTVSGSVDGTAFDGETTGSLAVAPHTLTAVIHKDYCNDVTVTRNIMVAKQLELPSYSFTPELTENTENGYEYIELPSTLSSVSYTIKAADADPGAKVSGSDGNTTFDPAEQLSGTLAKGDHIITVTVSKDLMISRTFEKKIRVVQEIQEPNYSFTPDLNGFTDGSTGFEYVEVAAENGTVTCSVIPKESGESAAVKDGSTEVSSPDSFTLGIGEHTLTVTVTKANFIPKTFTKLVKVVQEIQEPEYDYDWNNYNVSDYDYIEVASTNSKASFTATARGSGENIAITDGSSEFANTAQLGIGQHTLSILVKKDFYKPRTFTKKIEVVQEIQEPSYTYNKNGYTVSGFEYVEVASTSSKASFKATAKESGGYVTIKEGITALSNPVQLGIGQHTLTMTVSRENYKPQTFTKKIEVVLQLQEPNCIYEHNGYTVSGFDYIEVAGSGDKASFKATAKESGGSVTIKEGSSTLGNPAQIGIGRHTLTMTVSRANYKPQTFTKKVEVIQQLQKPTIKFYNAGGNNPLSTDTAENTAYSDYTTYNAALTSSGTVSIPYEIFAASDGGSVTVSGDLSGSSGTLTALGPKTVTYTVTKTNYKPRTYTDNIYLQGVLSNPSITFTNKTSQDGNKVYFSYLNYDYLYYTVSAGNSGNTISVRINNSDQSKDSSGKYKLSPDTTNAITVIQTNTYCKTHTYTSSQYSVKIKPINIQYKQDGKGSNRQGNAQICVGGFDNQGDFHLLGTVSLNNTPIWGYGDSKYHINADGWDHLNTDTDRRNFTMKCTSTNDTVTLSATDMRRRKGSTMSGTYSKTRSLSDIKHRTYIPSCGYHNGAEARTVDGWTLWGERMSDGSHYVYIYITFHVWED